MTVQRKVIHVVGTRPNFVKVGPVLREMNRFPRFKPMLVHTGQHYDYSMSKVFFQDLELPQPDIYLGVGSGSHAEQTAKIMVEFERVCVREKPDIVIVYGDVNSTLACSIVVAKLVIPLVHVEAGLRSFDRSMPEEINRTVTDSLSDYLFTTCEDANANLKREGIPEKRIYFVGNVMADTLLQFREKTGKSEILRKLGLTAGHGDSNGSQVTSYALVTLHRPSNVDNKEYLQNILQAIKVISDRIPVIFPIHPRTVKQLEIFGLEDYMQALTSPAERIKPIGNGIFSMEPLGYIDFIHLMAGSKLVLTDSGGIQEETTILGIPCLTLRENTERPVTVTEGTNILVGSDKERIISESLKILGGQSKKGKLPGLWDGKASERIVSILAKGGV